MKLSRPWTSLALAATAVLASLVLWLIQTPARPEGLAAGAAPVPPSAPHGQGPRPAPRRPAPSPLTGRPAAVSTGNWTNLYQRLYAVSALSSTEAWAGGEYGHLLHYTNGAWTAVDPPNLRAASWINDLRMQSPTSGWLAEGAAYQYDGSTWHERSAGLGQYQAIWRLAPLANDNVWAVGYDSTAPTYYALLHWNGTQWREAGPVLSSTMALDDIAMPSASDGWAVGAEGIQCRCHYDVPVVLHYDGLRWTRLATPNLVGEFTSVAAVAPGDVWFADSGESSFNSLVHYFQGTWTVWDTPDGSYPLAIYMQTDTAGWVLTDRSILHWDGSTWSVETPLPRLGLLALGGAPGQVWAVGMADAILSRGAKGAWTPQRGGPTSAALHGVAAVSPTEAWAVGEAGTILHGVGDDWQAVTTTITSTLYAVQMLSAQEGYAVGGAGSGSDLGPGVIAGWDGVSWRPLVTPAPTFYGLFMTGSGAGWAVGAGGAIWQDQGGRWTPAASPTTSNLNAVALDSPTHGWAVGGGFRWSPQTPPVLLEYTGGRWVDRTGSLGLQAPAFYGLALQPGGAAGWAVGEAEYYADQRAFFHLQQGIWAAEPLTDVLGMSVAPEALGEAWATCCTVAYHYTPAGGWQRQELPTLDVHVDGVALVPGRGGWAVGDEGTILRYNPLAPGQRFYDVPLAHPFYPYIEDLAAKNIISGYADNTFHPAATLTRGQLTKMVVTGLGWTITTPASPTFADVPAGQPFYSYVETAAAHGIISGYSCGGPGEPCDAQRRPYFRPMANVTRGQLSKMIVEAKGWGLLAPPSPTFADVPASAPFFGVVEQAAAHNILSGYACGGPGEPCPGRYFRPGAAATRGQVSKILAGALPQP